MGGNFTKLSNFNPKANYSLVRYGGNTPITEVELNETQLILSHRIKEFAQATSGDRFLEGGLISLDTAKNQFTIQDQALINEGRKLYINSLKETLNDNETVYLDIYEKDIDTHSEVKEFGNLQSTVTVDNTLLDPRLEGLETARRIQTCFNLVKETTREELASTSNIVAIGDESRRSRMGVNSKILQLEGNSYQNPETLKVEFVGTPIQEGYALDIMTAKNNIFNINTVFEGTKCSVEGTTLSVIPKTDREWNGTTCRVNVKRDTNYIFNCDTTGKYMIHILDSTKQILAMGDNAKFNSASNDYIFITFFCNGDVTLKEQNKATFSNISLVEDNLYKNGDTTEQSRLRLILPERLAKVGGKKDLLYQNSSNEWTIEKHTKTVLFDGTENINGKGWTLALEGTTTNCFKLEKACVPATTNATEDNNLNNYAVTKAYNTVWESETVGGAINSSGDFVIRLSKELAPSLQVFKNLLGTNHLEVTYPINDPVYLTNVTVAKEQLTNAISMDGEENLPVKTYQYTGVNNVITINDNKKGYTNDIYLEGNTVYSLPLVYGNSDYFKYNKDNGYVSNINKVEYRAWEEIPPIYLLEKGKQYTLTFKAVTDVICEIPSIGDYPTLKKGEVYIKPFTAKADEGLQIKIWSPNNEEAIIENLQLFIGNYVQVPKNVTKTMSIQSDVGLSISSRGSLEGETDNKDIMYSYRGIDTPVKVLRTLPNGAKDYIKMHEDEIYYYHKNVDEMTLTGRERLELVDTLDNGYLVVDLIKTLTKVKATIDGELYCDTMQVVPNADTKKVLGVYVTPSQNIRMVIDPSTLETADLGGVAKKLQQTPPTFTYELVKEEVYKCTNFDVKLFKGETTVTINSGELNTVFKCTTRENTGVGLYTFTDATSLAFDGVAPSSVTYVANYQSRLVQQEGHVYVPIATRVRGELMDLRIFDPNRLDFINEAKDPTNGVYTVIKALRQNGTLCYTSTLSEKDAQGNYTLMTIAYYDITGKTQYRKEKYRITYDTDGDIISKELMKQW